MQHTVAAKAAEVLQMKRRARIQYTDSHKALMWDRWRKGESLHQIARLFDRHHSSVRMVQPIALAGDIEGIPQILAPSSATDSASFPPWTHFAAGASRNSSFSHALLASMFCGRPR